jgi:hypothetical protein
VHLVLFGTGRNDAILDAFREGAKRFCPEVRVSLADGTRPELAQAVWHAADVYTSLPDSTLETFGLSIVEAMASGLPVVASDWDGVRDTVVDGETGLMVPTYLVKGGTEWLSLRNLLQITPGERFLAECNQATVVDTPAAADAYERLIRDPQLRARLGEAGRRRAIEKFGWRAIIRAHEELWAWQDGERRKWASREGRRGSPGIGPAAFPSPEHAFLGHPTAVLDADCRLEVAPGAEVMLESVLSSPLCHYLSDARCADGPALSSMLKGAPKGGTIGDWDALFGRQGIDRSTGRRTLAWLMKYGLVKKT